MERPKITLKPISEADVRLEIDSVKRTTSAKKKFTFLEQEEILSESEASYSIAVNERCGTLDLASSDVYEEFSEIEKSDRTDLNSVLTSGRLSNSTKSSGRKLLPSSLKIHF